MNDYYQTLAAPGEGLYKEKGSKFLSFAFPVSDEDGVKAELEVLRKRYYDARHHCYAYVLGEEQRFRAYDDGEPNHSAGDPILGQIRSRELTNTLVVVVRYFGGTKLGVGGLVQAYKTAAALALDKAPLQTVALKDTFRFRFAYRHTSDVMRLVSKHHLEVVEKDFGEDCRITVQAERGQYDQVAEDLSVISSVSIIG